MSADQQEGDNQLSRLIGGMLGLLGGAALLVGPVPDAEAISKDYVKSLTYEQVKGTGLANRCTAAEGTGSISISSGGPYEMVDFCMEPKEFTVLEQRTQKRTGKVDKIGLPTKLTTRQTYTLDYMSGPIEVKDGKITWQETDGIDFAPTTVQVGAAERVPFLFTAKDMKVSADKNGATISPGLGLGGEFRVPGYRTGLFLDPKGRGGTTGYDMAVALPGLQSGEEGDEELFKENNKLYQSTTGNIEMEIQNVNPQTGEVSGVFVSQQKSDTDLGAKEPKDILIKGAFYGRIQAKSS
ncbi:unnamed protein product [Vitrella brassicaformis CCMP3155]|uniref:Photosystem II manganese-stabilizing polypeptide n=3 Tax=Vitrella brassicaformis TaxID=1169539 RepID=A0A0G4EDH4_VITBC|nr:unnamed protein product [Vitrella brassicaformis CCMP3155]|eukprot:CEL93762.1 unnamed protein product [Vitrella brassicaformis CCMP3155]